MSNETNSFKVSDAAEQNCTQLGIHEFPPWFSEPRYDYLALAMVLSLFLFTGVAVLCDNYFLPAIDLLAIRFSMFPGSMYTTLVTVVTSSPELFVNLMCTFVAKTDLGTGTILGSTVFNILFVVGMCAVVERMGFSVHWWNLSRELLMYSISIMALVFVMLNQRVYWYESLILCCLFIGYVVVLKLDTATIKIMQSKDYETDDEGRSCCMCFEPIIIVPRFKKRSTIDLDQNFENPYNFWHWPEGKYHRMFWILSWPWNLVFSLTVPDCKYSCARKCYILTIIMCTIWMAVLAYLLTWAATIIAYILFIPETVLGLTYLAIGTSIPEAVSCVMLTRKGSVSAAVCNVVSSNTVDVLLCLGLPWLLQACLMPFEENKLYTSIRSHGLPLISITLIIIVFILYLSLILAYFKLTRKIAFVCLFTYLAHMTFCCALEMNVFYVLNPPLCPYE